MSLLTVCEQYCKQYSSQPQYVIVPYVLIPLLFPSMGFRAYPISVFLYTTNAGLLEVFSTNFARVESHQNRSYWHAHGMYHKLIFVAV